MPESVSGATYNHSTAAAALFFKNTDSSGGVHQALRVEVPEIGKEFTDNAYIGRDPEGLFYYDDVTDITGDVKAKVTKFRLPKLNPLNPPKNPPVGDIIRWTIYVQIRFYTSDESETYAEFIAEDPDDAVDASGMIEYTKNGRDGKWNDLNVGSANATVYKKTNESKITLTADSISKKATLTLPSSISTNFSVDVKGVLHFKKLSDVTEGTYASYNNDRIVFYQDDYTGTDFVAYFVPFEGSTKTLGITSANTVIISGVTWENLNEEGDGVLGGPGLGGVLGGGLGGVLGGGLGGVSGGGLGGRLGRNTS